jgi:hypothetical protein
MNPTRTLVILIFEDVEVLDFCGSFEGHGVFRLGRQDRQGRARRLNGLETAFAGRRTTRIVVDEV